MPTRLSDKMRALNRARRQKIQTRAAELIAEEMSLRELRRAHELTQERVARMLGVGQEGVSRLEQRSDIKISTLRSYVESLGGRLRLYIDFPGRAPIRLSGFATSKRSSRAAGQSNPSPLRMKQGRR